MLYVAAALLLFAACAPSVASADEPELTASITVTGDATSTYGAHANFQYSGRLEGTEAQDRSDGVLFGVMQGGGTDLVNDGDGYCDTDTSSATYGQFIVVDPGTVKPRPTSLRVRLQEVDGRWDVSSTPATEFDPGQPHAARRRGHSDGHEATATPTEEGCQQPGPSDTETVTLRVQRHGCPRASTTRRMAAADDCPGVIARIRAPKSVVRTDIVRLDGRRSGADRSLQLDVRARSRLPGHQAIQQGRRPHGHDQNPRSLRHHGDPRRVRPPRPP